MTVEISLLKLNWPNIYKDPTESYTNMKWKQKEDRVGDGCLTIGCTATGISLVKKPTDKDTIVDDGNVLLVIMSELKNNEE